MNIISDGFVLGFVAGLTAASAAWYFMIEARIKKDKKSR